MVANNYKEPVIVDGTKSILVKQPFDILTFSINLGALCQVEGVTVTGLYTTEDPIKIYDLADDADVTNEMLDGDPTITNNILYPTIKAGTDGKDYKIVFRVVLSNGDRGEEKFYFSVREE